MPYLPSVILAARRAAAFRYLPRAPAADVRSAKVAITDAPRFPYFIAG